ncbi:MAG: hypothetical protein M1825_004107 [Sarcosagium campestre]|nr:MAG: hypothetical protein M1825_004107 [Sarcosagium campestre]
MAASDMQEVPFVKQLAANDRPTRDAAVSSLRTFLSGRRQLSSLDLLKLWKGLFFCVWMSDRPRTQQRLIVDLAGLVEVLPDQNALPFLEAFWTTIAREWTGIDALRMDKFLLLVRSYLRASFCYLAERNWDVKTVEDYANILSAIPLSIADAKIPNGLRYHVIDIFVDELDASDQPRKSTIDLGLVLRPLRELASKSPTKSVRLRVKEALADERLIDWNEKTRGDIGVVEPDVGEVDEWNGFE